MRASRLLFILLLLSSIPAMATGNWRVKSENPEFLHRSIKQVTDVMVHDIYSPPVASRIYAYITIAGYEAAIPGNPAYTSLAGQLHQLPPVPPLPAGVDYSPSLASVQAVLSVARALVISEARIDEFYNSLLLEYKKSGMPDGVFRNSIQYGQKVAAHILAWASKDNYKETRSLPKYSVSEDEGTWKPTPPSYMKAVEPHWGKIRTFLLDSAQQFKPAPALSFSTDTSSPFYKEAVAVRSAGLELTPEWREIANFWDCNPFKMNIKGHVMFATKKISPGGHWINITRLACNKANANLMKTAEAYMCVSVTLADAFISCWDEKYRSNVIRPETYINQYIDPEWVPLLQTPPFPEYTSGHSVASMASAIILTRLFGADFSFADSSEIEFGLPVRNFKSFESAAEEAAISRYYGGIHYMPSIKNGVEEGKRIGDFIVHKLRTQKEEPSFTLNSNSR